MACRNAIGKTWGLKPKGERFIYTSVIIPMISYGSVVWWHKLKLKTYISRVEKVQRAACIMITGAM
ncbi:MAG: hypothetical protein ACRY3E_04090, partial [Candidatus Lariskella arthropodorum]